MANYSIDIVNGTASKAICKGNYSVTVSTRGYDAATLTPQTYCCTAGSIGQVFTVEGAGTLTINVNETGAAGGTPITGGSIVMTDSTGTTQYGSPVSIAANGNAVFEKVPYATPEDPFTLFFKQLASDDSHDAYDGVIAVAMNSSTQTAYVKNDPAATQTFTLIDKTYNRPIATATLTMIGA